MLLEVLVFSKHSATRSLCRHVHNRVLQQKGVGG